MRFRYSAPATSALAGAGSWLVALALAQLGAPTPVWLVVLAFGLACWTTAGLWWYLGRSRPHDEGTAERLADLLRRSYELRDRVRHTSERQVVFEPCQSFIDLGLDPENLLRDGAPEYASDFQDASRAPWALQGKAEVLKIMDARLRVHSEIVKKLRGRDQ